MSLPRSSATCWAVFNCWSAASVARTVLMGLLVPCDLVRMSFMPADSMTARIAPPEMTPVPGAAGLSMILADPHLSRTSCGMVVPTIGTVIMLRFATSIPLRIASVTSRALPIPAPTRPFMSPTTMSALNENLRPPFTTLATRLTRTTRSASSERSPLDWYRPPPMFLDIALKLQSGFARSVGERLDSAVIKEAAAVEHDLLDAGCLRLVGDGLAHSRGLLQAVALLLQRDRRRRRERAPALVVDDLRVEMVEAAEHGETRPLRGAGGVHAHAAVPLRAIDLAV